MARMPYDGVFNLYYATTIANINAPTVAEITASTDITPFLTADGWQPNTAQNKIDSFTIASPHDSQVIGTHGNDLKIELKRETPTDTAFDLFNAAHRDNGFIIADNHNVSGTLPGVGDSVEVYPVQVGKVLPANSSRNTEKTFMVEFAVTADPNLDATVA